MSEALYRKYRPQTFEDVVGQAHIERTLKNAIESDKVSHAYLFCGPRGTGKTTTARLLAKALLCEHGPTPSPDGTCEQCLAIADGTHPDVNEMDAASRTGVENVREEIISRVQFAPTQGRYKVYIIDEVHMLSPAAFNALLKTLEEPPSHVVFILCTTDPQKVPETIHSRCQRFDFHRLSNEEIVSRLGAVCMAEGIEFEGDALDLVAHRAQGGMRDALTALEQLAAFGNGTVTLEVAENVLGSLNTSDMAAIVEHIGRRDAAACFTWVSEYVETGADLAQFSRDLAEYIRNMYVTALTNGSVDLGISAAARTQMEKELDLFGIDRLAHILDVLGDLTAELRSSINPRLSFEIALTRMVRPDADLTISALAARIEALEAALASGASAPSSPAPSAPIGRAPAAPAPAASPVAPAAAPSPASASHAAAQPAARPNPFAAAAAQVPASPASAPAAHTSASAPAPANQTPAPTAAASRASQAFTPAVGGGISQDVAAKLGNPAALQRGWQATINDVKRQRAAYGALLLSAKVAPESDLSAMRIEFSASNTFAFGAVQRPDVSEILAASLARAFGGEVPFRFVQSASSAPAAVASVPAAPAPAAAAPMPQPAHAAAPKPQFNPQPKAAAPVAAAPAPARIEPAPWEDDAVPYDDADAFSYGYDAEEPEPPAFDRPASSPASARQVPPLPVGAPAAANAPARPSAPSSAFPFGSPAPSAPSRAGFTPPSGAGFAVDAAPGAEEMDAAAIFGSLGVDFVEVHE